MTTPRRVLAALAALAGLAWSASALAQLAPSPAAAGVPAAPAVPGATMGAAQSLEERLNAGGASGAISAGEQGRARVIRGTEAEAAPARRSGGFMQPTFAPLPGTPVVPQTGAAGFRGGYAPPGFFTLKGEEDSGSVRGLYTAPTEQPLFGRTDP